MPDFILPLTQSVEFESTSQSLGLVVKRFETSEATCLVQSRNLPVIGAFHLVSRGPIASTPDAASSLLNDVRREFSGPLVVNASFGAEKPVGTQIAKGAELALVDLLDSETMRAQLHQKWRNQLKKAERAPLTIVDQPLETRRHQWFFEAEAVQQKIRKYRSYPAHFLLAFAHANKGQARLYTALENGDPVAAMLVLIHGRMATYQAGVTTDAGRRHCAHNLLLWTIMCDLSRRNVVRVDLGRADLNAGLRRFKLGSGAKLVPLGGTHLVHSWFKSRRKAQQMPISTSL